MKILSITSIKSDYDLLTPLYNEFSNDTEIDYRLLVCGAHCSNAFGYTASHIQDDGHPILATVDSLIDGDTSSSRLKSAAIMLISSIDIVKAFSPDLLILCGDREDCLMGAVMGGYLGIPTAHFYGGDHVSDGHIDNPVRHAVSKLATVHFVSHETHKTRLLRLGEEDNRIFVIGSIALDRFRLRDTAKGKHCLEQTIHLEKSRDHALILFHPVATEKLVTETIVKTIILETIAAGYKCLIGMPNSDFGYSKVVCAIKKISKVYHKDVIVYDTLPNEAFLELFCQCKLIIGNSSAGILESGSVAIPAINVGVRQSGRLAGKNVIFCGTSRQEIKKALSTSLSPNFRADCSGYSNIYGDGFSALKAFKLIKNIDFSTLILKTKDPLDL